jgi:hypothetical protein
MEFFIRKNATLPVLKMQVANDGRREYKTFMRLLETATISFTMIYEATGIPKISNASAYITDKVFEDPNAEREYYVYYVFSAKDTNKAGRYQGQFLLKLENGTLICPIREDLYINIIDSTIS